MQIRRKVEVRRVTWKRLKDKMGMRLEWMEAMSSHWSLGCPSVDDEIQNGVVNGYSVTER